MRQILTETESAKNRFSALVPLADIFTGIPREKKRSRRQIIPLDRIGQCEKPGGLFYKERFSNHFLRFLQHLHF